MIRPPSPPPRQTRKVWAYPARLTEDLPTAKAEKGSVWYAVPVDDRAAPAHEDAKLYNLWKCKGCGGVIIPAGSIILRVHSAKLAFFAPTVPLELPQ